MSTVRSSVRSEQPPGDRGPTGVRAFLLNKWTLRVGGLFVVLAVWQFAFARVNPIFSAPPTAVASSIPEIFEDPEYFPAMWGTIRLFFTGYAIAAVIGLFLGLAIARFRWLDIALTPYLNALYASPLPALVPIITAILGYRTATKIVIVVLLAVFPILINAHQGARSVDGTMIEVARSFRVSEPRMWIDVIVPGSAPYLVVGLRLGAARGMIGTAVAELYTSPEGLGYLILKYGFRFNMDAMLVVVLTFTVISIVLGLTIGLLERRVQRWTVKT